MLSAELSRKFQEVLAAYLEAKEKGDAVDVPALLCAHPELAAELNEYFANEQQFAAAAAGITADAPKPRPAPDNMRIGEYELLDEIARGGMGVVYRARHVSLQRLVALKMLLGGEFAGRDGLRRFQAEAKVVADLDHPHIVPIYDVGEKAGQAYFCMKLIDGPSLKEQIAWYVGKPEHAARLVIQIARAVHYAHQRGILHRDLKPGNILLQMEKPMKPAGKGGKDYPISGIPKSAICNLQFAIPYVTDFGLAKRFQADGKASHSTAVVGTAAYMAPEQATGRTALTVTADVYSLGAILYELLTGRKPFLGESPLDILLQVVETEPPAPLEAQPNLDPDLAQICLKCLRKNPDERYASAEALAVELEQWLQGEPLTVRAPTRTERLLRWGRRHPYAAGVAGLIFVAVAGSIALHGHLNDLNERLRNATNQADATELLRADQENKRLQELAERQRREDADAAQRKAESLAKDAAAKEVARAAELKAHEESRRSLVQQYLANGQLLLPRGDPYGAAVWFAKVLDIDSGDQELHRIRLGTTLRQCPLLTQQWFFKEKTRLLRLSPAGDRLLIVRKDAEASLFDTNTGAQLGDPLRHEGNLVCAEFSPDGQWLATGAADGVARLWSAASGLPQGKPLKHADKIHALCFSADSKWIATASADKTARVWDVATTKQVGKSLLHEQEVRVVAFHPDGKKLLTVSENVKNSNGELRVWDLATGRAVPMRIDKKGILAAGYSQDGRRIFAVGSGRSIHLWDAAAKEIPVPKTLSIKGEPSQRISPGLDKFLQTTDKDVKIIDLPGGTIAHTLPLDGPAGLAQFSPGGRLIVTASANKGVRLWRADGGKPFAPALPHGSPVVVARFSANDQWLATACADQSVRLWSLAWPDKDKDVTLPKGKGTLLSVSPDGKKALLMLTKAIAVWDLEKGRAVGTGIPFGGMALQTRWAADSNSVAIANAGEVGAWEIPGGKNLLAAPIKLQEPALQLYFAPATNELAVSGKNSLRRWDFAGKAKEPARSAHVHDFDGQRLAVWKNKTLEIQDVNDTKPRTSLKLPGLPAFFRFNPHGQSGAVALADGSLRLWDLTDGTPMTPPFGPGESVRHLAYSADGRFLASATVSGSIRVWDAATGQALSPVYAAAGTLADLSFRADIAMLFACTNDGRLHRWSLRPQEGTATELFLRARRAAGQDIDAATGSLIPFDSRDR